MKRTLFVVALLAALVPTAGQSASAQVVPLAPFSGYSTGTAVHAGALESGTTRLVDSEIAFSGANVNSAGLGAALSNEMAQAYQAVAKAGDKSAGRGSGLEVGLATTVPNIAGANQINPGSTVQAFAPASTELLKKEFIPVDLDPIVNATTLRGQAQAIYSPGPDVCVLGQPISSGLGYAANANLVNTGTPVASLLATNTGDNAVNQSKSFTYLIPNGDGTTYGLVSETHQILAPITLIAGIAGLPVLSVEFAGEWVLRSTATGKPGGAKVDYAPGGDPTSTTKVLTIKAAGAVVQSFTTQEFLSQKGLALNVLGLAEIVLGEGPRAIAGATGSSPAIAANGTSAATAVDVLRVKTLAGLASITDLRVGHMESMATVPAGGIQCGIPVTKTGNPTTVTAGDEKTVTYTITVPADPEAFKVIACDIVNLKVVDMVTTDNPLVKFNLLTASDPGKISGGNTVTWDLGTYKPGDPAKVLTVTMNVPKESASGQITDVATATAVLGNCKGNASANATSLTGLAKLEAAAVSGNATLAIPGTSVLASVVTPANGATPVGGVQTGAGGTSHRSNRVLPIGTALGSAALLGALSARRRRSNS